MEFLQAATCADELEELLKRMEDDDEEVDLSGMVLEISGQQETVLDQGVVKLLFQLKRQKFLRRMRRPVARRDCLAQEWYCGTCIWEFSIQTVQLGNFRRHKRLSWRRTIKW